MDRAIDRVREICRSFPGTTENDSWGNATFRVSDRIFVWTMEFDDSTDRTAIRELIEDSYREPAPKQRVLELDS